MIFVKQNFEKPLGEIQNVLSIKGYEAPLIQGEL